MFKKIALFVFVFLLAGKFSLEKTEGFALSKIRSTLTPSPRWETEGEPPKGALSQPYTYLGSGAQAFAFVSEDGEYVLKFFRHHRATHPLAFLSPILPSKWKRRLMQTVSKRESKRDRDFTSYCIAYEALKEETGLLFLHLNKSIGELPPLTLYDKIGVRHTLNLDEMEFILQRCATPFYLRLEEWIGEQKMDEAKEGLSQLIALLRTRAGKGISDKDPDLRTNFGWIGGRPVQIDVGRFKREAGYEAGPDEAIRITDRLYIWLNERSPELADYLKGEL